MRYRNTAADRMDTPSRRPGRMTSVLLVILTITFLFGILVINSFFVGAVRIQQENATDASALAAAEVLADEALLYGDPSIYGVRNYRTRDRDWRERHEDEPPLRQPTLFCQAVDAGIDFGRRNIVGGRSFDIRPADLFFGNVDVPQRRICGILPADPDCPVDLGAPLTLAKKRSINSVQVVG